MPDFYLGLPHMLLGVPQESILGPVLFLVYVSDLSFLPLTEGTQLLLYADDILVHRPIHSIQDYEFLQNDLVLITQWLDRNLLELNLTKYKYILLTRRVSNSLRPEFIKLKGEEIEWVKEYKYLRLLITANNLLWGEHISQKCNQARKKIGYLFSSFSTPTTLSKMYLSFIRPLVECGAKIWDPYLQKTSKLLNRSNSLVSR